MPTKIEKLAIEYLGHRTGRTDELRAAIDAKYPGAVARARERFDKDRFEQMFIGSVPEWAKRFVKKHGAGRVSSLRIRQSTTKRYSSGHCQLGNGRLVVTFGYTPKPRPGESPEAIESMRAEAEHAAKEQRVVVLHEIAHAFSFDAHGERFYAKLNELLRAEGLLRAGEKRHGRRRTLKLRRAASR